MYRKISILIVAAFVFSNLRAQSDSIPQPPGVIINHIPKSTGKYIGSPSICILPNGEYVASHDEFGPKSTEFKSAITRIYHSSNKGATWKRIASIDGQFWSNLFCHNDALYIMGTNKHHGNVILRQSLDGGKTWTIPYDSKNGLLLEGEYHTAPVPILVHNGRIWRGVEYATAKSTKWGERYSAMVLSAPVKSDLLNAKNWTRSNHLFFNNKYLNGEFKAWLEGNMLVTKDVKLVDVLRVHAPNLPKEHCAIVNVDKKGKKVNFNPDNFFEMPGAAKKFTIRYDEKTDKYWSIVNYVQEEFKQIQADRVRNTLALISSTDLKEWNVERIILQHPDIHNHGFQYVDWLFEGNDIVFVSRTAFDDEEGGAEAAHDANFLTFHRVINLKF
jgi:hypothetical protein